MLHRPQLKVRIKLEWTSWAPTRIFTCSELQALVPCELGVAVEGSPGAPRCHRQRSTRAAGARRLFLVLYQQVTNGCRPAGMCTSDCTLPL